MNLISRFVLLVFIGCSFLQSCKESMDCGCLNNGVSSNVGCVCPEGYEGKHCEVESRSLCYGYYKGYSLVNNDSIPNYLVLSPKSEDVNIILLDGAIDVRLSNRRSLSISTQDILSDGGVSYRISEGSGTVTGDSLTLAYLLEYNGVASKFNFFGKK